MHEMYRSNDQPNSLYLLEGGRKRPEGSNWKLSQLECHKTDYKVGLNYHFRIPLMRVEVFIFLLWNLSFSF